jgi:hypothetical protein
MSGKNSSLGSGVREPQPMRNSTPTELIVIATGCLAIILALVVGVGLVSHTILRHMVQTVPLWAGVILGFRRSRRASWVALPLFLFWLILMVLIWCYLLGIAQLISGHFSPIEIAMTIIVGMACVAGIAGFVRFRSSLSPQYAAILFILAGAIQFICFRISFLPGIAHR